MIDNQLYSNDDLQKYINTLVIVYLEACNIIFNDAKITIEHSIDKGLYSEIKIDRNILEDDVKSIKIEMDKIILEKKLIIKELKTKEEALLIFDKQKMKDKNILFSSLNIEEIMTCRINKKYYYIFGDTFENTEFLNEYDLKISDPGLVLLFPRKENNYEIPEYVHQEKLFNIFRESEKWASLLQVSNVGELNNKIKENKISDIIRVSEALHEKKIAYIADNICTGSARIILIAGPSSSGKTTFANRLGIQLKVNGRDFITISLDDYFVEREKTPKDENGEYDFDTIDALDLELFNNDLNRLLKGDSIILPKFNFLNGKREFNRLPVSVSENQFIVIEGIHGLNDKLTKSIAKKDKYKVYISALTQLNIDDHNRISTTDLRLIRRLIRDNKYRGHDGERTMELWENVVKGENKYIFPFQENADAMFNSSLIYELTVLKKYALPVIEAIDNKSNYFSEKERLMEFLNLFNEVEDDSIIPNTSIIKEFIGGSCFR